MQAATLHLPLNSEENAFTIKALKVKVEAVKSDETGTISEETFDISIKTDAPQDRVERLQS